MGSSKAVALAALREQIRAIEGRGPTARRRVATGLDALDTLVEGLPRPGILELCGAPGSGRTRLALQIAAAFTERHQRVAWVDWERTLHPPAAATLGVDLRRFVIVRPPGDQGTWAAEQLIRSGCFPVVICSDPSTTSRAGQRWALSAEYGTCTVVVLRRRPTRSVPADVRVAVEPRRGLTVVRNRGAAVGHTGPLPSAPEVDPWG